MGAEVSKQSIKHSKLGIVSILMPPVAVVIYIGFHFTFISEIFFDWYDVLALVVSTFALALPPFGFLLAIIAIARRNRNLLFPIIGLVFNLATVLLETLFIWIMMEIG